MPSWSSIVFIEVDVLEKTKYFDTKNGVRVYNIEHFAKMSKKMIA